MNVRTFCEFLLISKKSLNVWVKLVNELLSLDEQHSINTIWSHSRCACVKIPSKGKVILPRDVKLYFMARARKPMFISKYYVGYFRFLVGLLFYWKLRKDSEYRTKFGRFL